MKKFCKKTLAFVLTFALLLTAVCGCLTVVSSAEGFDDAPTAYYGDNSYNAIKNDFDLYVSTSADTTHKLAKANFEDYFYLPSSDYPWPCMDAHSDNFWAAWGTNAYELINNKGIYDDFEISVRVNASDKDGNGGNDWAIPQLVFGKQDDTAWATTGSGFIASVLHDSAAQKAFYSYEDGDAVYDDASTGEAGATWGYFFIAKVVDGILTVTVSMPEWEWSESRTFDISDTYVPGSVGVRFLDNAQRLRAISLKGTPLPDTRPKTYDYSDLSTTAAQNAFKSAVIAYRGTNCLNGHTMEAVRFNNYFSFDGNKLNRTGGITNFDDLYPSYWNNRTRLVFNVGKFDDFKLTFSSYAPSALGYATPLIHFGMQKVDEFATDNTGYTAAMNYWPNGGAGQVYIEKRNAEGAAVIAKDTEGNNGIYGGTYGMDYVLEVKDGVATYTVTHIWPDAVATWTTSGEITDYEAGYVAIEFIDGDSDITNLKLIGAAVPNTALAQPEIWDVHTYNGYNYSDFAKDFTLLEQGGNADFTAIPMSTRVGSYEQYITYDAKLDATNDFWAANEGTRLIYNGGKYTDFEIQMYCNCGGTETYKDWKFPSVLFNNEYAADNHGDSGYTEFNPGGTSRCWLTGDNFSTNVETNFCGGKYDAYFTVSVHNGVVTYNVKQFGDAVNTTVTANVPSGYTGGNIGFAFPQGSLVIRSITVKTCDNYRVGDTAITDPRTTFDLTNVSDAAAQQNYKNNFVAYRAEQASVTKKFDAVKFDKYFKFANNKLVREGGITNFDDLYPVADNQRSRLVFNAGKFSDFELSFSSYSGDALGYAVPTVNFGMSDPAAYANDAAGYRAYMAYWPNGGAGQVKLIDYAADGSEVILSRDTDGNNGIYGGTYGMDYKLSVKNGVATYSITHVWPDTTVVWTTSTTLPEYTDGYIAIDFIDGNSDLNNLVLKGVLTENTAIAQPSFLELSGASLTLQDNIQVNFKADAALVNDYDSLYLTAEFNGEETVIDNYNTVGDKIVFAFTDINPDQMGDTITVTLSGVKDEKTETTDAFTYSVAQYCYNQLAKTEDVAFKTLLVDLLNYGAAAQNFNGYKTEALVNADLTPEQAALATGEVTATSILNTAYEVVDGATAIWRGAGLNLSDNIQLRFIVEAADLENVTVKFVVDEIETVVDAADFIQYAKANYYYVYFDELDADQLSSEVYATVYKDGVAISNTVVYSVESYVAEIGDTADAATLNLAQAMLKYGMSAANFNG